MTTTNGVRELLRRQEDIDRDANCKEHEQNMDRINMKLARQEGWFKAAAGFMSIAVVILGWFGTIIIGQLSSIEKALNKSDVISERHTQQISNIDARLTIVEAQHIFDVQKGRR